MELQTSSASSKCPLPFLSPALVRQMLCPASRPRVWVLVWKGILLTRQHKDSIQINKIRNEKWAIETETEEIKKNHHILLQMPQQN